MRKLFFVSAALALVVLSGCARMNTAQQQTATAPVQNGALFGSEVQPVSTQQAISTTTLTGFVDDGVFAQLSAKDRAEATSAQYYALQFGRPGAPRSWQGDTGASGQISVGPYVRVNTLDCREFSHEVTLAAQTYERKGTACREQDGSWSVAS